jgi:hypothetical protein
MPHFPVLGALRVQFLPRLKHVFFSSEQETKILIVIFIESLHDCFRINNEFIILEFNIIQKNIQNETLRVLLCYLCAAVNFISCNNRKLDVLAFSNCCANKFVFIFSIFRWMLPWKGSIISIIIPM